MTFGSPTYPLSFVTVSSTFFSGYGQKHDKEELSLDSTSGWRPAADSPGEHIIVILN